MAKTKDSGTSNAGKNITASITDNKLTLVIDLSKTLGESKSGKNIMVASTGGNVDVGGGIKLGLNAYRQK